jgi:WD40 repeat protein
MSKTHLIPEYSEIVRLRDCVETLSVSPIDGRIAAGSLAGEIAVIDSTDVHLLPYEHEFGVGAVAWSPNAAVLASGGLDGEVRIWSGDTNSELVARGKGWVADICWRSDGEEFAAAIGKQVVRIRVDSYGKCTEVLRHDFDSTASCLSYTINGQRLGVGSYGGVSWFETDAEPVRHFPWKGAPLAISMSPNGKWVATGNQDASIHCWKLWSGDDLQMSGYETKIQHLDWDPTSRYLAVGSVADISLWDFSGRGPKGSTPTQLAGHARHVVGLKYQPNSSLIMSAGAEGTVCFWQPSSGKRSLIASVNLGYEPTCASWSQDGSCVFVGTSLGGVFKVDANGI